jgi:hypothetical protein
MIYLLLYKGLRPQFKFAFFKKTRIELAQDIEINL